MYCSLILFLLIHTHTHLLDRLHGWWRVLVAAQIDHDPGDIAEEGDGDGGTDERKQGLDHTQADHIVSALRAITWREHTKIKQMSFRDWLYLFSDTRLTQPQLTYDVAQGPDGLFADVLMRRVKQPQEERHSIYTKETEQCKSSSSIKDDVNYLITRLQIRFALNTMQPLTC